MKRYMLRALLVGLGVLGADMAQAQDATIIHARVVVGDGPVIENGSIVVRDGRIVSVRPGLPLEIAGAVIDAQGMTAVPGFIDGHKHINTGPLEQEQMADLIENGFTTVLSGGGPADGNLALIQHIESGLINGPRVLASGQLFNLHASPEQLRTTVREMAAKGIRFTGEMPITPEPGPSADELAALKAVLEEGARDNVQALVHAVSTPAMIAATDAGIRRQVHLPNKDFMSYDDAAHIAKSGTIVLDLISFGAPIIDVFQQDDLPRFRTGLLWPESIAGANRDPQGRATGTEGAYTLINARRIWDASGGKALGFGSDQNYPVHDVLEHELKSLMVMFSMEDVIRILTINTASFLNMQTEIGTLEPLKRADIVLLEGNPFDDFHDLLKTVAVFKDGKLVVDKRTTHAADTRAPTTAPVAGPAMVGTLTAAVARPDQAAVVDCRMLAQLRLEPGRVTAATDAASSSMPLPATPALDRLASTVDVPAHCIVTAQLGRGRQAHDHLEVWLPSSGWNGNLLLLDPDRPVGERAMAPLAQGYAVATLATGLQQDPAQPRSAPMTSAVHAGVVLSKALIQAYYGGLPRYSYWLGGPDRTRVLAAVQMNPADFDGVVVGGEGGPPVDPAAGVPDLSAFAARGGKLIEYQGGTQTQSADDQVSAYQGVVERSGGLAQARRFYRLFLMPAAGPGESYRAQWLMVLDRWTQRGRAPDAVLADHLPPPDLNLPPQTGLVFEPRFGIHTVCAYPSVARLQNGPIGETPVDWLCLPAPEDAGRR